MSREDDRAGNSFENTKEEFLEFRVLTQEAVNEQIKGFIAPHSSARKIDSTASMDGNNGASEQLFRDQSQYHFWYSRMSARKWSFKFLF